MSKSKQAGRRRPIPAEARPAQSQQSTTHAPGQATRETIESIAIAVILAFLFRAFVAEAFVIPTGSMAPTLMGQHKDVECPECGVRYRAGASIEDNSNMRQVAEGDREAFQAAVVGATCPLCRYQQLLDLESDANNATFSGDRILVSKFIYDFRSPKRWDVIVFKYPINAKQNFIKRLIGLPGETVLIKRGDIFIKSPGTSSFHIARKPDRKLKSMLQVVDDSKYISKSLAQVGWPLRWQPWEASGAQSADALATEESGDNDPLWTTEDNGHSFRVQGPPERDVWLRYHHVIPGTQDWQQIAKLVQAGEKLTDPNEYSGVLITDFYAYNAFIAIGKEDLWRYDPAAGLAGLPPHIVGSRSLGRYGTLGLHWVSDLAFEGEVSIESETGELLLQLTKGGTVYLCRIDIASGEATLSIDGGTIDFVTADGTSMKAPMGETKIRGAGTYSIRYSNVDAEIRLWVNDKRIQFDGPTTYAPPSKLRPVATLQDPGDLAPVGIGSCGAALHVRRLRVLRDIYYIATTGDRPHEYNFVSGPEEIWDVLKDPTTWETTSLFDWRRELEFPLDQDQFFPMGDNSPQSSDARMWREHFFERDMLIGRALLIYWPHPWYRPIPYLPNVKRMRLIH